MDKIKRTFGFILTHPLSKRHRLKSIFGFLWWQLQCNISPSKFIIKPFITNIKFYARKGLTGVTGNIYSGLHEFNDMMFLLHFLRQEDVFFDIGANVGSYTLLAAGVCKANSISVEPIASTYNILNNNIALNNLQHIAATVNACAGAASGMAQFTSNQDTTNHVIAADETNMANIVNVPVITVDSLANPNCPVLIKIDVEGYETEVLKGMNQALSNPLLKAIIIELNGSGTRYGYDESLIHQLLIEKKFQPCIYDPFDRILNRLTTYGDHNTIYCRDIDFITHRLKNAAGIHIMGEVI